MEPLVLTSPEGHDHQGSTGPGRTILVVDDEKAIRDTCVEALGIGGYTTLQASSGEEALELLRKPDTAVDLIILDLNMPGMGGANCFKEILKISPTIRVIIATGFSESESTESTILKNSIGYLKKPYRLQQLLDVVNEALKDRTDVEIRKDG